MSFRMVLKGDIKVASCRTGRPRPLPVLATASMSEKSSRMPANRFVLFLADFAIKEILPRSSDKNVRIRSKSP